MMRSTIIAMCILLTVSLFCQTTSDNNDVFSYSARIGIGVFFDSSLISHPEVFKKIESVTGTAFLDRDVYYRTAYVHALSNAFVIVPRSLTILPTEEGRRRFVRIAEYLFSLFPSELLNPVEESFLKKDIDKIAKTVPSFYFLLKGDSAQVLDIAYRGEAFIGFLLPEYALLYDAESDMSAGVPGSVQSGNTVYLLSKTAQASGIQHLPGEVVSVSDNGFRVKIDVLPEYEGTSVTDIKGRIYGIVSAVNPVEKVVDVMYLPGIRKSVEDAGISLADVIPAESDDEDKNLEQQQVMSVYEVGETFFIITTERMRVFIDGKYHGETPLLLKNIELGEHILKLESEVYEYEGTLIVNPYKKDVITIKPYVSAKDANGGDT